MAKSGRLELEDKFTDITGLSLTTVLPFKVIQGHRGRYQSKARMRLPISDY